MDYQKFEVYGDDMPGFNDFIAAAASRGRSYYGYNVLKNKWGKILTLAIESADIIPIDKIFLHMIWWEPTKKRDPDNIASFIKVILDALQKTEVIENDGWRHVKGWRNEFKIGDKRGVEVRIYETDEKYNTAF